MSVAIRPFAAEHLDTAAALLAARHRSDRTHTPHLPARFEEAGEARAQVEREWRRPGASGVVALRNGAVAGYLIGAVVLPPPAVFWAGYVAPRAVEIDYAGHAVTGGADELYSEMYTALAGRWVREGCFAHFIELHAADTAARAAWHTLGFGGFLTLESRPLGLPLATAESMPMLTFRRAGKADIDTVLPLALGVWRHHTGPPMFVPLLPEGPDALRAYLLSLLDEPETVFWLAERAGEAVAVQTFHRQTHAEMARPEPGAYLFEGATRADLRGGGVGAALLRHALAEARQAGLTYWTLHHLAANTAGARFWNRHGFRPLVYRLARRIDERIAWASVD